MPSLNTILHGDCTQLLPIIPDGSIDFVLTDPPYVNNYVAKDGRRVRNDGFRWIRPASRQLHRMARAERYRSAIGTYAIRWRTAAAFLCIPAGADKHGAGPARSGLRTPRPAGRVQRGTGLDAIMRSRERS
jgi:DNA modification methylase